MIPFPNKKYRIIYADPPWEFGDGIRSSKMRNNKNLKYQPQYKMQSTEYICSLPVEDISLPNSVLFIWTTDAHLPSALEVINAWGFQYKTIGFIWNKKTSTGKQVCYFGQWTCKGSEICLLAIKGRIHTFLEDHTVRQLVEAERRAHSQKPDEVRKRIEKMFGNSGPRIELFARERFEGWDAWGDEV